MRTAICIVLAFAVSGSVSGAEAPATTGGENAHLRVARGRSDRPIRCVVPTDCVGSPGVTNAVQSVSVAGYPGPAMVCTGVQRACSVIGPGELVPIGAFVDTQHGAISLETTRADGKPGRTNVYGGIFQLLQAPARGATVVAKLAGGDFRATCGAGSPLRRFDATAHASRKGSHRVVRKLWSDGVGRTRTMTGLGSAETRGTRFLVADRCDGTLIQVTRGQVEVFDRRFRSKGIVRAPNSYILK